MERKEPEESGFEFSVKLRRKGEGKGNAAMLLYFLKILSLTATILTAIVMLLRVLNVIA